MSKSTSNKVTVESWTVLRNTAKPVTVPKVTVRVAKGQPGAGQFHGATNFRGTFLPK